MTTRRVVITADIHGDISWHSRRIAKLVAAAEAKGDDIDVQRDGYSVKTYGISLPNADICLVCGRDIIAEFHEEGCHESQQEVPE